MSRSYQNLTIVDHPLINDKLSELREFKTPTSIFKQLLDDISLLLFYEATRNLPVRKRAIQTPLERLMAPAIDSEIVLAPILRAGLAMVNGITPVFPRVKVGMIGMYRDHETLQPVEYFLKLPKHMEQSQVFLLDPMLATGGSAVESVYKLKEHGAVNIAMIAMIAAPEGVARLGEAHPNVHIFTAALDRQLNEIGYILPGLGDAGDRYFGT